MARLVVELDCSLIMVMSAGKIAEIKAGGADVAVRDHSLGTIRPGRGLLCHLARRHGFAPRKVPDPKTAIGGEPFRGVFHPSLLAQILGVEPSRQGRRADEIACYSVETASYERTVHNACTGGWSLTITTGVGQTFDLEPGAKAELEFNTSGVAPVADYVLDPRDFGCPWNGVDDDLPGLTAMIQSLPTLAGGCRSSITFCASCRFPRSRVG
jgi:hypothetical protein